VTTGENNMDKMEKVLKIAEEKGIIRPKDVQKEGLPRKYVYRLHDQGKLEKIDRGLYKIPEKEFTENQMLLEVAKKCHKATICLLSALRFHEMTSQNPHRIWIAVHNQDKKPEINVPLKVIRMTGKALTEGREEHKVDGISLKVYTPAKTVADCFKFRNKIGLDVAIEALREYKSNDMGEMSKLWEYAKLDRVHNVIQPYAEAIS